MIFANTSERLADSLRQFKCWQDALRLHDALFAMHPHRLDRIQPRTLRGQGADQQAHTVPLAFDLLVMRPKPTFHSRTDVPRGIVPDQGQHLFAESLSLLATPRQEAKGQAADRVSLRKAQPDFFRGLHGVQPTCQQPVADQGLGPGIIFIQSLFYQAHRVSGLGPRSQVGLGETTPPRFILKAQDPLGLTARPANQAISYVFLRAYAASGLVIQCFARIHFTPNRLSVARIVSPLTSSAVRPCSKLL